MEESAVQLPRYRCHTEVWAAKIQIVERRVDGESYRLSLSNNGYVDVDDAWYAKHKPELGGYFVQYDDGYRSYSPAAAFESGYALTSEAQVNAKRESTAIRMSAVNAVIRILSAEGVDERVIERIRSEVV